MSTTSPNRKIPAALFRQSIQNTLGKIGEASPGSCTHKKAAKELAQGPGGVIISPTLLHPVLVWSQ